VSVPVGGRASFGVSAISTGRITYQWRRDGIAIAGATAASYLTPAVTLADDGATFSVRLCNALGCRDSDGAVLTVTR
jgi:hypothetical protein